MNRYLFLVSLTYAFPILRPLQRAIRERGDEVAWFFDETGCRRFLHDDERELRSVDEVLAYNPVAVFTAGNHMYDFFPGIKVQLFHGFNIDKRPGRGDHFALKGWFDLYCTQGETSTVEFQRLARKHGYFKVAETGWPKVDGFYENGRLLPTPPHERPIIMYSSTFTTWITSTPYLFDEIQRLVRERDWEWVITFHPKMDRAMVEKYRTLEQYENVTFYDSDNNVELLRRADVMICDSSSIIVEFLLWGKPVVTFRNTAPGDHLIDIDDPKMLESSIEKALTRPATLMAHIQEYVAKMHPYADGRSSERVLDAVEQFLANDVGHLKRKPLNLVRKWQARKKLHYFPLWQKLRHRHTPAG